MALRTFTCPACHNSFAMDDDGLEDSLTCPRCDREFDTDPEDDGDDDEEDE